MSARRTGMVLACWSVCASVWGQSPALPVAGSADLEQQRQQIGIERQQRTAELDAQETACAARFAVNDCQNKVNAQRRAMLTDLKRREARLNDADRKLKGAEQVQRSQDKAVDRAQREADLQTDRGNTPEERQQALDEKVANHQKQAQLPKPPNGAQKIPSGLDEPSKTQNRLAFDEKQRAAEKRRLDKEKRLLEKGSGSPALPPDPH